MLTGQTENHEPSVQFTAKQHLGQQQAKLYKLDHYNK